MIFYFIFGFGVVAGLALILGLVFKKLPDLALMNVESIAEEKAGRVKNRIILDRLKSKVLTLQRLVNLLLAQIRPRLNRWYQFILELERKSKAPNRPLKQIEIKSEIDKLLEQANQLAQTEKINEAEEIYIQILELDAKKIEAYQGLAEIYRQRRDYKKARETCRYLIKLLVKKTKNQPLNGDRHRLAAYYADLGEIYQLEGKLSLAAKNFQQAVTTEPSNPRFLDLLLKISILLRNKDLAWKTFNQLKETDPENQKLAELKEEISNLPEAPPPAIS